MPQPNVTPLSLPEPPGARLIARLATAWVLACAAMAIGFGVWALDRGLDLLDGSFYVLCALQPEGVRMSTFVAHWFTAPLWRLTGSLVGFRAIGLMLLLAGAWLLAWGAVRAYRAAGAAIDARHALLVVAATTTMGALMFGVLFRFDPSYNLLAAAATYGAVGLALLGSDRLSDRGAIGLAGLAGVLLGIVFLCKFSAGVMGLVAAMVGVALWRRPRATRAAAAGALGVAMAAMVLGTTALHMPLATALAEFRTGAKAFGLATNESVTVRLGRYGGELRYMLYQVRTVYLLPILAMAAFAFTRRWWLAALGLAGFAWTAVAQGGLLGGMHRYIVQDLPLAVALLLALIAQARTWTRAWKTVTLTALLVGLPFGIAVGTSNNLNMQIIMTLASWGTLAGCLAVIRTHDGRTPVTAKVAAALFVTVAGAQLLTANHLAPYALARSILAQTIPVTVDRLGTFRVDPETHLVMQQLAALAAECDIQPGRPLVGLYASPGVALLLKADPPVTPWLFNRPNAEAVLAEAPPDELRAAVVALTLERGDKRPPLPEQYAAFPTDYRLCGSLTLPFRQQRLQLWLPAGR